MLDFPYGLHDEKATFGTSTLLFHPQFYRLMEEIGSEFTFRVLYRAKESMLVQEKLRRIKQNIENVGKHCLIEDTTEGFRIPKLALRFADASVDVKLQKE